MTRQGEGGRVRAMLTIDPSLFLPEAIAPETAAMNAEILRRMADVADIWSFPPETARESRRKGRGPFPLPPKSPRALTETIAGLAGPITIRIVAPANPRGAYLHLHGGGWMLGQADFQD